MLSEESLRARVDDTLRMSYALDALWRQPIGPEALQAEIDRTACAP